MEAEKLDQIIREIDKLKKLNAKLKDKNIQLKSELQRAIIESEKWRQRVIASSESR